MKIYKIVLLPIEVSEGDYCFGGKENRCCPHYDNEGGHSTCGLNIDDIKYDRKTGYVKKPDKCKCLNVV